MSGTANARNAQSPYFAFIWGSTAFTTASPLAPLACALATDSQKREIVPKRPHIVGFTWIVPMARNEDRRRIILYQRVQRLDPFLRGCVDQIGQRAIPEEIAAEDNI